MNIIVLIIGIICLILFLNYGSYFHGHLVGLSHSSKIKSTFTYIDMKDYSKNLDDKSFVNGYLNGISFLNNK